MKITIACPECSTAFLVEPKTQTCRAKCKSCGAFIIVPSATSVSTSEEPIPQSLAANLDGAAAEGAELIGISVHAKPTEIVTAINRFLMKPNKGGSLANVDNWDDRALPLGSLWGTAMVREFRWHWTSLIQHDDDDSKAIALVNPDRSLAIFPFHYCFGCLENEVTPTVLLAFNMLKAG